MTSASILGVGLCLLAAASQTGGAPVVSVVTETEIIAGVRQSEIGAPATFTPVQLPGSSAAGLGGIDIDFDDVSAPCSFFETSALRAQYSSQGVVFWGNGPNDGGAVLNECSNFSVTGQSSPNFLAFNVGAGYSSGGTAGPPEFIRLLMPTTVSHLEIRAGTGLGTGTLTLTGVRADGTVVATTTVTLVSALQTVAVNGPGMVGAIITSTAGFFVVDDLVAN
jgi:hypothetical protein